MRVIRPPSREFVGLNEESEANCAPSRGANVRLTVCLALWRCGTAEGRYSTSSAPTSSASSAWASHPPSVQCGSSPPPAAALKAATRPRAAAWLPRRIAASGVSRRRRQMAPRAPAACDEVMASAKESRCRIGSRAVIHVHGSCHWAATASACSTWSCCSRNESSDASCATVIAKSHSCSARSISSLCRSYSSALIRSASAAPLAVMALTLPSVVMSDQRP
mmetsp:Transcript_27552/g.87583  ORF Transcript_27552/g.87583 Transcript_27552/m.87583 type:complete len:221 (-) Transcript_27552:397-1059(-)